MAETQDGPAAAATVGTVAAADNKKRRENTPEDVLLVAVAIDGVSLTQQNIDG